MAFPFRAHLSADSIRDLLINPILPATTMMEGHDDVFTPSHTESVAVRGSVDLLADRNGDENESFHAPKPAPFTNGPLLDSLHWNGYDSDEDTPSTPDESDSYSICSASSGEIVEAVAVPARVSLFIPSLPSQHRRKESQTHCAQAVNITPIVKAAPRLVDIPASPTAHRHSHSSSRRRFSSQQSQRSGITGTSVRKDSFPSTPRVSSEARSSVSRPSTPVASVDDQTLPSKPDHCPQASSSPTKSTTTTITSPSSAVAVKGRGWKDVLTYDDPYSLRTQIHNHVLTPMLPQSLRYEDPYPLAEQIRDHIIQPLAPTRQNLRKLSLATITRLTRKSFLDSAAPHSPAKTHPPRPDVYQPTRSPQPRPKLIARGANEVEPTLVLPPCPEGWDETNVTPIISPSTYAPSGAPSRVQKREVGVAR